MKTSLEDISKRACQYLLTNAKNKKVHSGLEASRHNRYGPLMSSRLAFIFLITFIDGIITKFSSGATRSIKLNIDANRDEALISNLIKSNLI